MDKINGAPDPDELDAAELFPHTKICIDRMRTATIRHGKMVPCYCPAKQRRASYLYLINRARKLAQSDAYAKVRHQARVRAERARSTVERQAFEEVAALAEALEVEALQD